MTSKSVELLEEFHLYSSPIGNVKLKNDNIFVKYWIVSNETNTDVRMYNYLLDDLHYLMYK